MGTTANALMSAVTDAISSVITWIGTFITSLTDATNGALKELLPLFAVGIAISAVLLGKPYSCPLSSNSVKLSLRQYRAKPILEGVETRRGHQDNLARYSPICMATCS